MTAQVEQDGFTDSFLFTAQCLINGTLAAWLTGAGGMPSARAKVPAAKQPSCFSARVQSA